MRLLTKTTAIFIFSVSALISASGLACGQDFNNMPRAWKWLDNEKVAFSYDETFTDAEAFAVNASNHKITAGIKAPAKYTTFPANPEGAVNLTFSPDSSKLAFTRDNDLYVYDIQTDSELRLTYDGSETILNGYASWVYYEEILGRPSKYKAFWWSPDSKKIGFYRFDNSSVNVFPIFSPFGQDGSLRNTRYPKAGESNPKVKIGIISIPALNDNALPKTVWADFNEDDDQYFGIPFWGADSKDMFIAREPRIQNTLDLYRVSSADGSKSHIYHEEYKTWLNWIDGMLFTDNGLYMARSFETGWQQLYFLSYDGKTLKRLTDGPNWRIALRYADKEGNVYFTACRDASVRNCLYEATVSGEIKALTDTSLNVSDVRFAPDGKHFVASLSNFTTPTQLWLYETATAPESWKSRRLVNDSTVSGKTSNKRFSSRLASKAYMVANLAGPAFNAENYALPKLIYIENDGLKLPAYIVYPKNFDPTKKYPVHVDIYGGPDNPMVRDRWIHPNSSNQWWSENDIIEITADCRAAGHNGHEGMDQVYKHLNNKELDDFKAWAHYLQSLPYVKPDKIGVEGFSFGGTMTTMLLFTASDCFHYGIAGGGVYDWALYDTHYGERFMETPQANPDGYRDSRVINYVSGYPVSYKDSEESSSGDKKVSEKIPGPDKNSDKENAGTECSVEPVMLKITHGTGDDNVHFQNTLQLIDEMQKQGKKFEFMIYPDGMHGYRGYQGAHFQAANREFWLKYLCE